MIFYILMFMLSIIMSMLMMLINFIFYKKSWQNREKLIPFECGFDPIMSARMPFSIHFFLISLIFLIFDIEIILMMPILLSFNFFSTKFITTFIFIMIMLLIGIYLEWNENSIKWFN